MSELSSEKLQKVLARAGVASRREAEAMIQAGRVKVNGLPAGIGDRVVSDDKIHVDDKLLRLSQNADPVRIVVYNKPEGEICTRSDPENRPTVFRRLPSIKNGRWITVGRLDINTTGLLLFTTDGELANRLMHPSSGIDREYVVRIRGEVEDGVLTRLREGVLLDDGMARFSDIKAARSTAGHSWYHVTIMEGRNREVRRLWESQDLMVSRLKRARFGPLFLPSRLKLGQWEYLGPTDAKILYELVGLPCPEIYLPRSQQSEAVKKAPGGYRGRAKETRRSGRPTRARSGGSRSRG